MIHSKDLQIDWLRTFLAVVDTGSMTAAARQVARSQSAVSMQLKKLEDSLGRPLFKREPRQLKLTPAGYDLLGHARKLLEAHSTMVDAMRGGAVSGRVTLGVPDDYALTYLMPALRGFMTRFGEVEVTLVCEDSASLWTKVDRGQIDLALVTRDGPSRGELLFREALVWGGAEQHETWKRSPLPIAIHGLSERLRKAILAAIAGLDREYRVVYNSPNVSGQLVAMESGLAVAVVTRCSLPAHLKVLDARHGLPELPVAEVVLTRSRDSIGSCAVDALSMRCTHMLQGRCATHSVMHQLTSSGVKNMSSESALPWVLIPGFMLDESLWDEVIEHMPSTQDIHLASLLEGQTIPQIAQHIASSAPPRFVLVGFSLGGYVARSLVQQFPDRVATLVLIATSLRADSPEQRRVKQASIDASAQGQFRGLSFATIAKSVHPQRANDTALIGRIREMGARMGHAAFATQSLLDRADVPLGPIQCPTLIIAAVQDRLRQAEEAQELCMQIPGARLEVIEGSGHMVPLEQPETLARLMWQWLAATVVTK